MSTADRAPSTISGRSSRRPPSFPGKGTGSLYPPASPQARQPRLLVHSDDGSFMGVLSHEHTDLLPSTVSHNIDTSASVIGSRHHGNSLAASHSTVSADDREDSPLSASWHSNAAHDHNHHQHYHRRQQIHVQQSRGLAVSGKARSSSDALLRPRQGDSIQTRGQTPQHRRRHVAARRRSSSTGQLERMPPGQRRGRGSEMSEGNSDSAADADTRRQLLLSASSRDDDDGDDGDVLYSDGTNNDTFVTNGSLVDDQLSPAFDGLSTAMVQENAQRPFMMESLDNNSDAAAGSGVRGAAKLSTSGSVTDDVSSQDQSRWSFVKRTLRGSTNALSWHRRDRSLSNRSRRPPSELNVFIATWNMNHRDVPDDISHLMAPATSSVEHHMVAISVQEGTPARRAWELKLQEALGADYFLVHSHDLMGIHICLFALRKLAWFISGVESAHVATKLGGMLKTKGGVGISLRFNGLRLLFINSHLPAHTAKVKDRYDHYMTIRRSLGLPHQMRLSRALSMTPNRGSRAANDITESFDMVFWCGDLNYRVSCSRELAVQVLKDDGQSFLLVRDQLVRERKRGGAFHDFSEAEINFPPTYKYDVGTTVFDTSPKQRVPSWTDRVLYKCNIPGRLACYAYDWIPEMMTSDHKPVYASFGIHVPQSAAPSNASSVNSTTHSSTVATSQRTLSSIVSAEEIDDQHVSVNDSQVLQQAAAIQPDRVMDHGCLPASKYNSKKASSAAHDGAQQSSVCIIS